jgi:hypothetical protein
MRGARSPWRAHQAQWTSVLHSPISIYRSWKLRDFGDAELMVYGIQIRLRLLGVQRVHEALGYEVVDRCVHYRKTICTQNGSRVCQLARNRRYPQNPFREGLGP